MPIEESREAKPRPVFDLMDDVEIVRRAQDNDPAAVEGILLRYHDLVGIKSRMYFLIGADHEDIQQEGMIGLYKAVRDYREDREASFKAFAELCITRQIITAVKTATRQKHSPLNTYISLQSPISKSDDEGRVFADLLPSLETSDPADSVIEEEEMSGFLAEFDGMLSELEVEVLERYMRGMSYREIADDLDRHVKSIDNALQRIKRKIQQFFDEQETLARKAVAV